MLRCNPSALSLYKKRPKLSRITWVLLVRIITGQWNTTSRILLHVVLCTITTWSKPGISQRCFALCCKSLCKAKLQNTTNMTTVNPAIRSIDKRKTCLSGNLPTLTVLNLPLINRFHKPEASVALLISPDKPDNGARHPRCSSTSTAFALRQNTLDSTYGGPRVLQCLETH